jgi:hypothetical protein
MTVTTDVLNTIRTLEDARYQAVVQNQHPCQ